MKKSEKYSPTKPGTSKRRAMNKRTSRPRRRLSKRQSSPSKRRNVVTKKNKQSSLRSSGPVRFSTERVPIETITTEGFHRFLVQHAPYGMGIVQRDHVVLSNSTLAKMLGYRSASDVETKEVATLIEEGSLRSYRLLERRALRGESIPSKFEMKMRRTDGTVVHVESSLSPGLYNDEPAVCIFVNDRTEQKQLEQRLVDSERLFRNVVNSMVDALVITDLQGKVLDVNEGFERLTGFQRREVAGSGIPYPWVPEEDLKSYIGWLEQLREKNFLKDFDVTWRKKDDTPIAVSMSTTLLRNTRGEPALMVNIARDISERQQAQQTLSQQFQRLQVLYELSRALTETWNLREIAEKTYGQVKRVIPVDLFSIDLYEEGNNTVRPLFMVDRSNGQETVRDLPLSPLSLEETPAVAKVVTSHESVLEHRAEFKGRPIELPEGEVQQAAASLMYVPMFSKNRIIGVLSAQSYERQAYSKDHLAFLESIASVVAIALEKVKLYQETIAKSQEIEARNKELDDFTYVVSHDLKEPLISVEGYAKILKQEYSQVLDESGRQFVRSILEACSHMKKLIEDLLQLSRVGKLSEVKHDVDLRRLLAEVIEELRFTIQERKVQVKIAPNLPHVVSVEPFLKVIFRNLISNAIKFCDKAIPVVEIGVRPAETPIFFVRDNGIGIPPEYHDKIFMIFQRLHKREDYEGTGAGLTIAKKIIEVHGGRIWVESAQGMGSTFYFTLPSS